MGHLRYEMSGNRTSCTLRLIGELDVAEVESLRDAIAGLACCGGDLYLDLGELSFLDAAGIRFLETTALDYATRGRRLALINCRGVALQVLRICALDQLVECDAALTPDRS
jgi:anti-anti-sigma factor